MHAHRTPPLLILLACTLLACATPSASGPSAEDSIGAPATYVEGFLITPAGRAFRVARVKGALLSDGARIALITYLADDPAPAALAWDAVALVDALGPRLRADRHRRILVEPLLPCEDDATVPGSSFELGEYGWALRGTVSLRPPARASFPAVPFDRPAVDAAALVAQRFLALRDAGDDEAAAAELHPMLRPRSEESLQDWKFRETLRRGKGPFQRTELYRMQLPVNEETGYPDVLVVYALRDANDVRVLEAVTLSWDRDRWRPSGSLFDDHVE